MTTETSYALTRPAYVDQSHLVVTDLPLVSNFYQSMLGLSVIEKSASGEILGVDGTPLLTLTTGKDVRVAPRNAAGLFHTAFLMPSRTELARWLRHAAHNNVVLDGASDHLVSEAIYLSDPEGNGIEIYADRSHDQWKFQPDSRGAGTRAEGMTGLSDYTLRFNDKEALEKAVTKLDELEIKSERRNGGVFLHDPWGIGLTLSA